ncbi:MAG: hypothetical protein KF873_08695 [Gemmataceae bacterium]|nr:hypothetical protein [Gemmataceae bacterium]
MTTERDDDTRRVWRLGGLAGVLLVPLMLVWWPGCRQYEPVKSREALGLMQLLYAACNTKDPVRLARVESGLDQLAREGKLSAGERTGFDRVLAMAKAGDWPRAEAAAFKFAQDQVGVGHPAPEGHDAPPSKAVVRGQAPKR